MATNRTIEPGTSITTWIEVTDPDEVKPGMKIRVIEKYKDGPTVTYEGQVNNTNRYYTFTGENDITAYRPGTFDPDLESVTVYRQPKELPMAKGSAIKVYDPSLLCERVAVRRLRGDVVGRRELAWFWADTHSHVAETVPNYLLDDAEILFDAGVQ